MQKYHLNHPVYEFTYIGLLAENVSRNPKESTPGFETTMNMKISRKEKFYVLEESRDLNFGTKSHGSKSITLQTPPHHTYPAFQRFTADRNHLACKISHCRTSECTPHEIEYPWPRSLIDTM